MLAGMYWRAGVTIVTGTDGVPPRAHPWPALYDELVLLNRRAGMPPAQVIRAATLDGAKVIGQEAEMGSIEPGKLANFTVLADNPVTIDPMKIKDIKVLGTVQEGRVLPVTTPSAATADDDVNRSGADRGSADDRIAALDRSFERGVSDHLVRILSHGH